MLFRIYFLYVCKIGLIGIFLTVLGFMLNTRRVEFAGMVQLIGMVITLPICVAGGVIALLLLVKPKLFTCPLCFQPAEFTTIRSRALFRSKKKPAVHCEECGLVYCKNLAFSFDLKVVTGDSSDHDMPIL